MSLSTVVFTGDRQRALWQWHNAIHAAFGSMNVELTGLSVKGTEEQRESLATRCCAVDHSRQLQDIRNCLRDGVDVLSGSVLDPCPQPVFADCANLIDDGYCRLPLASDGNSDGWMGRGCR